MKLLHIDALTCPTCAAVAVQESRKNQHCNGQFNEKREFACGCVLHWCPNFRALEVETSCPSEPVVVERSAKRVKAFKDLTAFVEALDVDDDWRSRIKWFTPRI